MEAAGWRVPLYLGGGLAALAVIGVILAIVALASQKQEVAQNPTPTPGASAVAPLPTTTVAPTPTFDPNATPTPDPNFTPTPDPNFTPTPEPEVTEEPDFGDGTDNSDSGDGTATSSTYPDWSGTDGWTVIIKSAENLSDAESTASDAESKGLTIGILNSDNFSSLNGGWYVVFSGEYASKSEAQDALPDIKSDYPGAYVRKVAA